MKKLFRLGFLATIGLLGLASLYLMLTGKSQPGEPNIFRSLSGVMVLIVFAYYRNYYWFTLIVDAIAVVSGVFILRNLNDIMDIAPFIVVLPVFIWIGAMVIQTILGYKVIGEKKEIDESSSF